VLIDIAHRCGYLNEGQIQGLDQQYDRILGQLVRMATNPDQWKIR
jgi:hypothetical protein